MGRMYIHVYESYYAAFERRNAWPMAVERNGKEVARSGKKCSNAVFSYYEVTFSTETGESYIVRNTAGE